MYYNLFVGIRCADGRTSVREVGSNPSFIRDTGFQKPIANAHTGNTGKER